MPRKPPRPRQTTDPAQHKRFLDMAREVEVDESPDALDRAFEKVVKAKRPSSLTSAARASRSRSARK
jgi:hypothetical protein